MSEEKMIATEAQPNKKTSFEIIIYIVSLAYACFFLYTAFRGPFVSTTQRGFHVCGGIIIWALYDLSKKKTSKINKIIDVVMIVFLAVMLVFYVTQGTNILMPTFEMTTPLYILGIIFMLCIMEAARRTIGIAVPILSILGLLYAMFGAYIPGTFGHPGFREPPDRKSAAE